MSCAYKLTTVSRSSKWPSRVTQGHRKCHGSIERVWFPIIVPCYGCIFYRFHSQILVENCKIHIPSCILQCPPPWGNPVGISQTCLLLGKLEWWRDGATCLKKVWRYVKPFRYNVGTWQTDRRTEFLYQYRASALVCCWRAIKTIHGLFSKTVHATCRRVRGVTLDGACDNGHVACKHRFVYRSPIVTT